MDKTQIEEVKENLLIKQISHFDEISSTTTIALAISKDCTQNSLQQISSVSGKPLNNIIYDSTKDVYVVDCLDYIYVGIIPISFSLEMEGMFGFSVNIPVPESILLQHLDLDQKKRYDSWKSKFDFDKVTFQFLQMIDSY